MQPSVAVSATRSRPSRGTAVSLIKIIVITLAVILSILFFGRFLF
jgi:hypothetical protein